MAAFHVWIRPLGNSCRVRVDGRTNAEWLLNRLNRSFALKTCEPMSRDGQSACFTFGVAAAPESSCPTFDLLMKAMPEVELMSTSAWEGEPRSGMDQERNTGCQHFFAIGSTVMNRFQIWLRPLGSNCRVRVDGVKNAQWLLTRLSESFVFKTSEEVHEDRDSSCCTFRVPYSSQVPRRLFEKLLASIPELKVMVDPA